MWPKSPSQFRYLERASRGASTLRKPRDSHRCDSSWSPRKNRRRAGGTWRIRPVARTAHRPGAASRELAPPKQGDQRRLLLQRLAPALFAIDEPDDETDLAPDPARPSHGLERRAAGGDHVFQDGDWHARTKQLAPFDPLPRAVPLGLLAHVERV